MVDHNSSSHTKNKHSFSVDITSMDHVSSVELSKSPREGVVLVGDLGEVVKVEFIEGIMLQISGDNGVIRMDILEEDLVNLCHLVNLPLKMKVEGI